jgi:hypothetical protein
MSDNSTRWQRIVSQSGDKPRFQARQTTSDLPPPQRRSHRRSRSMAADPVARAQRWWAVSVFVLTALAAVLIWLVFFT